MKKWLVILFVLLSCRLAAQQYNNEWIDYTKTYYKFKLGSTGLYRINQAVLTANNLGNIPAEQFQLWRNGKQVPIYTSVATGALSANDYIEFWGEMNDGKPDSVLYRDPTFQLSNQLSLETDTAAFFLTADDIIAHNIRYVDTSNNVAANTLTAEPYFIHSLRFNFRDQVNSGLAYNVGQLMYSSSYDQAEFLSTSNITTSSGAYSVSLGKLYKASSGPAAIVSAGLAGNMGSNAGDDARNIQLSLNGSILLNPSVGYYTAAVYTNSSVPLSLLADNGTDKFTISIANNTDPYDQVIASFVEVKYPRLFDFGGTSDFYFKLPASLQGNYLQVTDFNWGSSAAPVLYDITNHLRYTANISTSGVLQFVLQPSSVERRLVLVSQSSGINYISSLTQRTFTNYSSDNVNYIIISNKVLYQANNSANPVVQYSAYRSSTAGGGYNTKVYDIDDLTDQFAYGIKKHPSSIRNFIRYLSKYNSNIQYLFLIGRAVTYNQYRMNEGATADQLDLVPTFGYPASDALLVSSGVNPSPIVPFGRLAAISQGEVANYLTKVQQYESQVTTSSQTIENKAWMKQVVHVSGAGAGSTSDETQFVGYLAGYESIIRDTLFGGTVTNFNNSTAGVSTISDRMMSSLFTSGFSLLTYFGHGSENTLEYNLDDPTQYNNTGKYPVFLMNGCNVGDFYSYDLGRLTTITGTLAENWILTSQKGSIGFIGCTNWGIANYLNSYSTGFYQSLSNSGYGKGIGWNMTGGLNSLNSTDVYARMHQESFVLHGDPAVSIYNSAKPDFVVETPDIVINPLFISVANTQFTVKAYLYNIGKATGDSVNVLITRQYPNGTTATVFNQKIKSIRYEDSVTLTLPIVASRDKGTNIITVTIDNDRKYNEITYNNNSAQQSFVIYEDELTPAYPYNYSIVHKNTLKLIASTANPLAVSKQYVMELDTTALFNSPMKVTKTVTSSGGEIEFDPGITFMDSTVYYWEVAPVPSSGPYIWNTSSFLYLSSATDSGFNQSHLYQHLNSVTQGIYMDSTSRKWTFNRDTSIMSIYHCVFPDGSGGSADPSYWQIQINGGRVTAGACVGYSIIFNVFDPVTLTAYYNQATPSTTPSGTYGGFMGSALPCSQDGSNRNFEFGDTTITGRNLIRNFLDWIPSGVYVTARLILTSDYLSAPFANDSYAPAWKSDDSINGAGNSMYDRLLQAGFTTIDSFDRPRTFVFVYKKNDASYPPVIAFTNTTVDHINLTLPMPIGAGTSGTITSPQFGPAVAWKKVKWRGYSSDVLPGDSVSVNVIGVDTSGNATTLYTLSSLQKDFDISSVSATKYPYIKLSMNNSDTVNHTPYQLTYWRVLNTPAPEGALAPNISYSFTGDTLAVGQPLNVSVAFKNISDIPFSDSLKVQMQVTNSSNVTQTITASKLKKLVAGDTAVVNATIPTASLSGNNTFYVNVNPNYAQPEQYLFNNFMYKNFYVKGDNIDPILDVTFDGVHILNGDIVSAKPTIQINLTDESKYLALNDTSLIGVSLQFPDGSIHKYQYGTDTLHFVAANLNGGNNTAITDFTPTLSTDGQYILYVTGKDKSNNTAGTAQYQVTFTVNNTPMISNVFNYPNPFTTSTAFVFVLTGSQVPSDIKIQILTVTGKIVKEITKQELGPIHIGNNITEYKWNGTDMYGQKLANGVYLYRVITNLNGSSLGKYQTGGNTDQYFKAGYGKMYLMR